MKKKLNQDDQQQKELIDIVEVLPNSSEQLTLDTIEGTERISRAFPIPLVSPLSLPSLSSPLLPSETPPLHQSPAHVNTTQELIREFSSVSFDCQNRGPKSYLPTDTGEKGRHLSIPIVIIASFVASILSLILTSVGYHPGSVFSISQQSAALIFLQFFIEFSNIGFISFNIAQHYPIFTRKLYIYVLAMLSFAIRFLLYMFSKSLYFSAKTQLIIKTIAFVPGYLFSYIFPTLIVRECWRYEKRKLGNKTHSNCRWTPSPVCTFIAFLFVLISCGSYVLVDWNIVGSYGKIATVLLLPFIIAEIMWSLAQTPTPTWSGGHAIGVPVLLNVFYPLSSFLDAIISMNILDNGAIVTSVKFFAFYLAFGVFFSITQAAVSLATTSFQSPQYLFMGQMFLETYIGLAFVQMKSENSFWLTLILQSAWALFSNSGLKPHVYLKLRDWAVYCFTQKKPEHTKQWELDRTVFFFQLNAQSILCDLLNAVILPIVISIDFHLRDSFENCTVSCGLNEQAVNKQIERYMIVLAFRIVQAIIVIISYCVIFSRLSGAVKNNWRKVLSAMLVSFQLHLWRNVVLIVSSMFYIYSVFFPLPQLLSSSSVSSLSY